MFCIDRNKKSISGGLVLSNRDDINDLYNYSEFLGKWCSILFWFNVIISLGTLLLNSNIRNFFVLIQIIGGALYIVLKSIDDGLFWYNAESARRKNNIQKAFGIIFSEMETDGYYNNSLKPSVTKYAVNTLESNFFSKYIAGKMLIKSALKSILAVVMMVIVGWYASNQDVLLIIVQVVFSVYIIEDTVMLSIYKTKMDKLYDEAFTELVTLGRESKKSEIWMLSYVVEYEAVKAHYKIRLDSTLFNKYNPELSKKWEAIEMRISNKNV